jgi:hypothetical protein
VETVSSKHLAILCNEEVQQQHPSIDFWPIIAKEPLHTSLRVTSIYVTEYHSDASRGSKPFSLAKFSKNFFLFSGLDHSTALIETSIMHKEMQL